MVEYSVIANRDGIDAREGEEEDVNLVRSEDASADASVNADADADADIVDAKHVKKLVDRRLLPWIFLYLTVNYLDRANLAFASLQMNSDLGLSTAAYANGAAVFYISYILFEVPSNLVLVKVGPIRWLAIIMLLWSCFAACFAFVRNETDFLVLRFCLGAAEAGAFPGVSYYLTTFYSAEDYTLVFPTVSTATALSGAIGGPLAAGILSMDGVASLRGWQWLFIIEAVFALPVAIALPLMLPASPKLATFLSARERVWLQGQRERENEQKQGSTNDRSGGGGGGDRGSGLEVLKNPLVWHLSFIWFLTELIIYACIYFIPAMVKGFLDGQNDDNGDIDAPKDDDADADADGNEKMSTSHAVTVSLLASIPYSFAAMVMVLNAWHTKKTDERRWHTALPLVVSALAFGITSMTSAVSVPASLLFLSVAAGGIWATHGPLLSQPYLSFSGPSYAVAYAAFNALGQFGGLIGPWLIGALQTESKGYETSLLVLAVVTAVIAPLPLSLRPPHSKSVVTTVHNSAAFSACDADVDRREEYQTRL